MSALCHGVAVRTPCVICMFSGDDVINSQMTGERFLTNTKTVRRSPLEVLRNNIARVIMSG